MCCDPSCGSLSFGWIKLRFLVWCEQGHKKGSHLRVPERSYLSATIPGHWNARRTRQEQSLDASAAPNLTCGAQGSRFDSLRGHLSFAFKSRYKEENYSCAYSVSVASNLCKLWQNYSHCNHVQLWQLAQTECLLSFHLQRYSLLVGSYIIKKTIS